MESTTNKSTNLGATSSASSSSADDSGFTSWEEIQRDLQVLKELPLSQVKQRKMLADDILERMEKEPLSSYINQNFTLAQFRELTQILNQHRNARIEPMEQSAKIYFKRTYQEQGKSIIGEPKFFNKFSGDQLGRKMTITYVDKEDANHTQHMITYYIKTHQYGSKSGQSSVQSVDPKELLVYKFFEYLGIGPKTHFFFNPRSSGGFYIATQDAGFSKIHDKQKKFSTFEQIQEQLEKNLEENPAESNVVNAVHGVTLLDILSRIFRLHDITTNPSNFGRVIVDDRAKWKVIDFRVDTMDYYTFVDIFKGFQSGNGMYSYHGFLGKVLRDSDEKQRMVVAKQVLEELSSGIARQASVGKKNTFREALIKAAYEVAKYSVENYQALGIKDNQKVLGQISEFDFNHSNATSFYAWLESSNPHVMGDFGQYVKAAMQNFHQLKVGVEDRCAELTAALPNPPSSSVPAATSSSSAVATVTSASLLQSQLLASTPTLTGVEGRLNSIDIPSEDKKENALTGNLLRKKP